MATTRSEWRRIKGMHPVARRRDGTRAVEEMYRFTDRLYHAETPNDVYQAALDTITRALGCSRQHLARAFRAQVGIGPKELGRVARVQRALERIQRRRHAPLADAALDLGYFDEAHMDRDFRDLVGVTPARARGAAGSIRPIPSLWNEA